MILFTSEALVDSRSGIGELVPAIPNAWLGLIILRALFRFPRR